MNYSDLRSVFLYLLQVFLCLCKFKHTKLNIFLYGGPTTSTVSTTTYGYLYETYVSFTDINNQPIQANAYAHNFLSIGDTNGVASLPLLSTGSMVDVLYQGAGVRAELIGNQAGQSVQIITVPQGLLEFQLRP